MRRRVLLAALASTLTLSLATSGRAQTPFSKIGELDIPLLGVSATVDPLRPVVPKNVASAVRIVISAGGRELSAAEVTAFLGGAFSIEAELSGPGLAGTLTLPLADAGAHDPLLLPLPALAVAGDYDLSNIRVLVNGTPVLDPTPAQVSVHVIDQILVTSVKTRPLTLDEIREKGIVLDSDSYLGFQFTMGLKLDSKVVSFSFPAVFDSKGVAVPLPTVPPGNPVATLPSVPMPTVVPLLLDATDGAGKRIPLVLPTNLGGGEIHIPSVLVIPGNVGYLKQFFSAQLYVANGAPAGSGLVVHDVTGTINLPPGPAPGQEPLTLPDTVRGPQPSVLPVKGLGPDGQPGTGDDTDSFQPAEQGQAEFLIRGEKEGFYTLNFDIAATLDGLPVGPVSVKGKASGGVLVRNGYFDMSFMVPSVVRNNEPFKLFVSVTNIGQGIANDVHVTIDSGALSSVKLLSPATQSIDTLLPAGPDRLADSKQLEFDFLALRTGQVKATYLKLDTENGSTGELRFTLAVDDRGVALSPDTLALPAAVDALPSSVVDAAMRVLGQAWSVANAPTGTVPVGVARTSKAVVTQKALALAEAGLRVTLGETQADAVRDLAFDFHGGQPLDVGFDQLLRKSDAGRELAWAIGVFLRDPAAGGAPNAGAGVAQTGGVLEYEAAVAQVAVSGPDFISFAIGSATTGAPVGVMLTDSSGRVSVLRKPNGDIPFSDIPGVVFLPLGPLGASPTLGLVLAPSGRYVLRLAGREDASGTTDLSVTLPRGDGTFVRGRISGLTLAPGLVSRVVIDPSQPEVLELQQDTAGDDTFATRLPFTIDTLTAQGPHLVSASLIGPETLAGAGPFGFQTALLFDRVVDAASAGLPSSYDVPRNSIRSAKRQLSGRLVFMSLEQPEGPYVPATVAESGVRDWRGVTGPDGTVPLRSLIPDPGAVVSGRVLNADGTPAAGLPVIYTNQTTLNCDPLAITGLARTITDGNGAYEFRYVRQDNCGSPFGMLAQDPVSRALRSASTNVRTAGEQIVLDLVLLGRGSVQGTVTDQDGVPVPAARVVVQSIADRQSGGAATTDGSGRFFVDGISVGAVSVAAAKGAATGRNAGTIGRAGTTATVDVRLVQGFVSVSGTVRKTEGTSSTELPGVPVVYYISSNGGWPAVAVQQSGSHGEFAFDHMPAGAYRIEAALNTRDRGSISGPGYPGEIEQNQIVEIVIRPPASYGTVSGTVRLPDGAAATAASVPAGVVVSIGDRGALAAADGTYTITGVPVKPNDSQTVTAASRDGLRRGTRLVQVNSEGEVVGGVDVTLSGLGSVTYTVLDAHGQPVPKQLVLQTTRCADRCGCDGKETDANGVVTFESIPVGTHAVKAIRPGSGYVDVAVATATLKQDGTSAFGILRFPGAGTVGGTVLTPDGDPVLGAEVSLTSLRFVNDPTANLCGLVRGESRRAETGQDGTFGFAGVNVGSVAVSASQAFLPTVVGATGTLATDGARVDFVLRLVDTMAGVLEGRVLLPDGATPAGAGVEVTARGSLPDLTVVTCADGRYHFGEILPQGSYTLLANDPMSGGVTKDVLYLAAGQDVIHDLRLKGRATVRVTVVDGADVPVTSAFVRVRETSYPNRTYEKVLDASSQGVATFDGVFEGPISVEASDPLGRGGRTSSTIPPPGGLTVDVKVRLTTTGTVKGVFRMPDAASTPIPYGLVSLSVAGRIIGQIATVGTGPDVGSYEFEYVPAGQVRLDAQDPATGRKGVAVGTIVSEGQVLPLDVVAQALGVVTGTVRQNGTPKPDAKVTISSGDYRVTTYTDASGVYGVEGVPEGRIAVTAAEIDGSFAGTNAGSLVGEGTVLTLDVDMRSTGSLEGHVVSAVDGSPAPISVVTLRAGGLPTGSLSTGTDPETGAFSFHNVPSGSVSLSVDVLGSVDRATAVATVPANDTGTVTITLNGVGSIEGIATDSAGNPAAGFLQIQGSGEFPYTLSVDTTAALENGRNFRLPEALAGPFTAKFRVQSGTFTLWGTASGTLAPGQALGSDVPLIVQVQDSGTVRGQVFRSDGVTPAYGSDVKLTVGGGRGSTSMQAQNDGSFQFDGVPTGVFQVDVIDPVTTGRALVTGTLAANGETNDVGTLVLDDSPVSVVAISPVDGASGVSLTEPIQIVFSDPLKNTGGVTLSKSTGGGVGSNAALSADGRTLTLSPPSKWPDGVTILVSVGTGVTDVFGRHPAYVTVTRFTTVDTTPPSVASIQPGHTQSQVPLQPVITVTFTEDLLPTQLLDGIVTLTGPGADAPGGTFLGTTALTGARTVTFTLSEQRLLLPDSTYHISVNGAVDLTGNRQTVAVVTTFSTLDTISPSISFSSSAGALTDGTWLKAVPATVRATFSDALSGVNMATASLSVDAVLAQAQVQSNALVFGSTGLTQGTHVLQASVSDNAGNVSPPATVTFGIDLTSPVCAAVGGAVEGQEVIGTITLLASVAESGSGLAKVDLLIDGTPNGTFSLDTSSISLDTKRTPRDGGPLSEGRHTLACRGTDVAGNVGAAGPAVTVVVNNQQTVNVSISTPARDDLSFGASVDVEATPSERIDRMDFFIGGIQAAVTTPPYAVTLDLTSVPEGRQKITVNAIQGISATGTASRYILVDHTPPAAPDASLITAQVFDDSRAVVTGLPGTVDANAGLLIENTTKHVTSGDEAAAGNGSFGLLIAGAEGDTIAVTAFDAVGNASQPTTVIVGPKQTQGSVPLAGLQLWLKADVGFGYDSDGTFRWQDQSVNGNDATQPAPASPTAADTRPIHVDDSGNGVPAVRFDGTNDRLTLNTAVTGRTVFLVLRNRAAVGSYTNARAVLGLNNTVQTYSSGGYRQIWSTADSAFVRGGGTWLNGVPVDGTDTDYPAGTEPLAVLTSIATEPVSSQYIGSRGTDQFWPGDIAEVLVYNIAMSPVERQAVENYLARKYLCYTPKTVAPVITPNAATFSGSTIVSMSSASPDAAIRYTLDGSDPTTSPTAVDYVGPFTLDHTVTIKAIATAPGLLASDVRTVTLTLSSDFNPTSVPGLQLWLRPDGGFDETDAVGFWRDQSGIGNDAVQPSSAAMPLVVPDGASGMPAVRFDGAGDYLKLKSALSVQTAFLVVRNRAAVGSYTNARALLGLNNTVQTYSSGGYRQIWSTVDSAFVRGGGTWLNGVPVDGTDTDYPAGTGPLAVLTSIATEPVSSQYIGSRGTDQFWPGDVAEVLMYSGALRGPERHQIEEYLMRKYASVPGLPPSAPSATPNGGVFTGPIDVSLSTTTPGATIYYTLNGDDPTVEQGTLYEGSFPLVTTTLVKAKAYLGGIGSATAVFQFDEASQFNPTQVDSLQLWLRADAVDPQGGSVTSWRDQSIYHNDATQTFGGAIPALVTDAASGMPLLRFDGTSDGLKLSKAVSGRTVFLVVRNSAAVGSYTNARAVLALNNTVQTYSSGGYRQIWSTGDSAFVTGGDTWLDNLPVGTPTATSYPAPTEPLAVLTSIATDPVSSQYIGSRATDQFWPGDIAEVLVYGDALTDDKRLPVLGYLMGKYKISTRVTLP